MTKEARQHLTAAKEHLKHILSGCISDKECARSALAEIELAETCKAPAVKAEAKPKAKK
jgi:hypothetical protein